MKLPARTVMGGLLLCTCIVFAGCKRSNPNAPSKVFGKVTYNGSTVPGGMVYFFLPDGGRLQAAIGLDGSYSLDTKDGTYAVTVETESINPAKKQEYRGASQGQPPAGPRYGGKMAPGGIPHGKEVPKGKGMTPYVPNGGGANAPQYIKIPGKYASKDASNLSVTVKGPTKFDIELKD